MYLFIGYNSFLIKRFIYARKLIIEKIHSYNINRRHFGAYFVALAGAGDSDAITLELSEPMREGYRYAFQFFDKAGNPNARSSGLAIGLSDEPDRFGSHIFSTPKIDEDWLRHEAIFTAPVDGKYITVKIINPGFAWILLDNFSMTCPDEISLGNDTAYCEVKDIVLALPDRYYSYRWQDGSTEPTYTVEQAGTFSVEVSNDQCTLRDTIIIREIPFNCNCRIYVPNVFSANGDGVNDTVQPTTPCPLIYYEWRIFNRWGQLVFRTGDINFAWDGRRNGQALPDGVYLYVLRYKFSFQTRLQTLTGDITKL